IGQTHRIVNSGKHSREFWAGAWNTAVRGGIWREEVCNRAKDGSLYWTDATIAGLRGAEGKINKFIAIRTDITERKLMEDKLIRAQEAAESANKSKSEFLANMSHEIRTPMNAIIGMTDLLLTSHPTAEQREYLTLVQSSAESLLAIINDILDFSKIEAGHLELDCEEFDLRQRLGDMMKSLAFRAHAKGLELACRVEPGTPRITIGDANRLRQVLTNLVGN
ncbi:MAG: hypothetical protein KDA62_23025, partial [Planctomycetales bacterium]|nr:hypothetical protein [Planctomycetales bacterium]